jgi:hypothetical protein
MNGSEIIDLVESVTKKWCKQRKAEERDKSRELYRHQSLVRYSRVSQKEAAWEVMEEAYLKASSNGRLPAQARQIMYAARPLILERCTDKEYLDDKYFTQTLLPDYLREHADETANWDVVFDARGHFHEPHTGHTVPLGTLDVRRYLKDPSRGPANRYGAILFIEKEGFMPLFRSVRLAERYDLAIMSTKGLSVTAARHLVDRLCSAYRIPLLVLHDFDKAGFSIIGTLKRSTRRYEFRNKIRVIDVGLRIEDVQAYDLEAEPVVVRAGWQGNLKQNGATAAEIAFLCNGQRVELNAFSSGDLVAWIETKLKQHGVEKVIPQDSVLEDAYRSAAEQRYVEKRLRAIRKKAKEFAAGLSVPAELAASVRKELKASPEMPWDLAIHTILGRQES